VLFRALALAGEHRGNCLAVEYICAPGGAASSLSPGAASIATPGQLVTLQRCGPAHDVLDCAAEHYKLVFILLINGSGTQVDSYLVSTVRLLVQLTRQVAGRTELQMPVVAVAG
jgi:hypothetical protein